MAQVCSRCLRELPLSAAAQYYCPFCGFRVAPLPPELFAVVNGMGMRLVAQRQRWLLWCVLLLITASVLLMLADARVLPPFVAGVAAFASLAAFCLVLVRVVLMLAALRQSLAVVIVLGILAAAPCVNLLVLVIVSQMATGALRKAGIKVGFMGASDKQVLLALDPNICRQCGYNLTGNVSGRCPECGTDVPRLIAPPIPLATPVRPAGG